ncbi:type II toxin-antitoxin system VapC family toxin [Mesorhizobium sp. CC13]|uniref:PIN domain-containing protein n=1 Tax=Mesorhizobium sp. CC13 TaxID=3029194 RepID=UPI003264FE15
MSAFVVDTSAVLAVLLGEPGQSEALRLMEGALISSVSVAEIVAKCVELRFSETVAIDYIEASNLTVVDFNHELAIASGLLQRRAPKGVLSLGDRACLALALRENATAVTADRIWSTLDLGCPIELIR